MDKQVLKFGFKPAQKGEHFTTSFDVPEGTDRIDFEIKNIGYPGTKINVMVYDPDAYRGMQDKDRFKFFIGDTTASNGFLPGVINGGTWKLTVDLAKIEEASNAEIAVLCRQKAHRWYSGDLHTHTSHSDGNHSIDEAALLAKKQGLDFIALTDHNTYSQNTNLPLAEDFAFIPGMELTTCQGHVNFLGVEKPLRAFDYSTEAGVVAATEEASEAGAYISINHPLVGDRWRWAYGPMTFHAVEIWNGTPLARNESIIEWWQEQLSEGKRIYITGGSDVHCHGEKNRWYGKGRTLVYTDELSSEALIRALKDGHNGVAASDSASFCTFNIDEAMMGDTVAAALTHELAIKLKTSAATTMRIYNQAGLVEEAEFNGDSEVDFTLTVNGQALFYRVELWHKDENNERFNPYFTNPIYIGKKRHD